MVFVISFAMAPPNPPFPADPWILAWIGFPVVGAIVLVKRPGNRIGLIQLLIGVCAALTALCQILSDLGADPAGLALVSQLVFMPVAVLVPLLILLFPSGRPPASWWRVPIGIALASWGLLSVWYAVRPVSYSFDNESFHPNPLGVPALAPYDEAVLTTLTLLLVLFALGTLIQAIVSYRRADRIQRLQTKWLIAPAISMPILWILGVVVDGLGMVALSNVLVVVAVVVGANGIAAGIGVAVLRYRLYGIDRIVSRTVSYGLVVVVLAATYFGTVGAMSSLVGQQEPLVVAVATLVVAALFNPLRRRVRDRVDRRFNRSRYDAALLMDDFAESLRARVDPDEVVGDWVEVVNRTMQPSGVGVWTR
jgi:hypothetical protein